MFDDEPAFDRASLRLLNALGSVGIDTVNQFLELERASLMAIPGIGPATANEAEAIQDAIRARRRVN